jgi:hypothetical protein
MKFLLLFASILLVSCSGPESPAEASSSVDAKNPPVPAVSPGAKTKSPVFDVVACDFLTEADIIRTLGDQVSGVSFQDPFFSEKRCKKGFTLTLANGNQLRLLFSVEPSSLTGVEKEIESFTDNAKDIPSLIKVEMAPDGESYIGTHVSQRRLYLLRSGEETFITISYDVRGAQGGKTPEEVEARRQMGILLLHEVLKE